MSALLKFKSVSWKNFLSTGNNWITVYLDASPSTLIVGKNGDGKSQMIDALFFGCFGKAFRKINKPALINSRNGKGLEVKVEFEVGSNKYEIHRGLKPAIFNIHCNGKLINQDASIRDYQQLLEDTVLHMNHQTASQVVILGSATYVPFMQLKASERRNVIEEILDIKVFTMMNAALKERITKLKVDFENNNAEIQRQYQNKNLLEQLFQNEQKNRSEEINIRNENLKKSQEQIKVNNDKIETNENLQNELDKKIEDLNDVKDRRNKLNSFNFAFNDKIEKIKNDLWFFEENEVCPTCLQDIDSDHKDHVAREKQAKMKEFQEGLSKLETETIKTNDRLEEINKILKEIIELGNENSRLRGENMTISQYITKIETEIKNLENKKNEISDTEKKLKDVNDQLKKLEENKKEYMYSAKVHAATNDMLKDGGIKTQIIKQYLPIINKSINKYLQNLGFAHSFELDEEFKETIKSHFIDEFSYENFSEGEKQRIDLALLLAWRHVAKLKGSIKTNLLVMDETFDSSMDQAGVDDLMNLFMSTFGKDINLFVISHRGDAMLEKFEKVIRVEKIKGYSEMKEEK